MAGYAKLHHSSLDAQWAVPGNGLHGDQIFGTCEIRPNTLDCKRRKRTSEAFHEASGSAKRSRRVREEMSPNAACKSIR